MRNQLQKTAEQARQPPPRHTRHGKSNDVQRDHDCRVLNLGFEVSSQCADDSSYRPHALILVPRSWAYRTFSNKDGSEMWPEAPPGVRNNSSTADSKSLRLVRPTWMSAIFPLRSMRK